VLPRLCVVGAVSSQTWTLNSQMSTLRRWKLRRRFRENNNWSRRSPFSARCAARAVRTHHTRTSAHEREHAYTQTGTRAHTRAPTLVQAQAHPTIQTIVLCAPRKSVNQTPLCTAFCGAQNVFRFHIYNCSDPRLPMCLLLPRVSFFWGIIKWYSLNCQIEELLCVMWLLQCLDA
jgi:hypothetical protein